MGHKWEVTGYNLSKEKTEITVTVTPENGYDLEAAMSSLFRYKLYIEAMLNHAGRCLFSVLEEQHAGDPDRIISDTLENEIRALILFWGRGTKMWKKD